MEIKIIKNNYHLQLCSIIQDFCEELNVAKNCFSSMKSASYDDHTKYYVYDNTPDMEVVKLDILSTVFNQKRDVDYTPRAVDAVCINNKNEWFLIEFKNSAFDKKVKNDIKKKMLSSLWFLFSVYSLTGNAQQDITAFSRENITYIAVCAQSKNLEEAVRIHEAETMGKHHRPPEFQGYIGYYFKDAYLLTEQELRRFIRDFK